MIDCPCSFGKNLKENQKNCPICGVDLTPLHRLKALPKSYYNEATVLAEQGNLDEAIEKIMLAVSLEPGCALFHVALGDIYVKKCLYDKAIKHYERALEIDPNNEKVRSEKGKTEKIKSSKEKRVRLRKKVLFIGFMPILVVVILIVARSWQIITSQTNLLGAVKKDKETLHSNFLVISAQKNSLQAQISQYSELQNKVTDLDSELKKERVQHAQIYVKYAQDALAKRKRSPFSKKKLLAQAKYYISLASEIDPLHKTNYEAIITKEISIRTSEIIEGNRGYLFKNIDVRDVRN